MSRNNLAEYFFHQGTNFSAYEYLGCNLKMENDTYIYSFRTWAPNATMVSLISDFSGWDNPIQMTRISDKGIWELIYSCNHSLNLSAYKYQITSPSGTINKGDPYAKYSRGGADGASLIFESSSHKWTDKLWLSHRKKRIKDVDGAYIPHPINIYEVHLASFLRHEDNSFLSYREAADIIAPYLKMMGYTHIELLPIMEHPFDGSWGYQVCAFYAPTSRFGNPDDFRYFVNKFHEQGIGVILDWVPAHFPKDEWGLYKFDGSDLYEYQGVDRQESASWGTRFFDLGREEVQSFLISNALYYLKEFHIDGLRVDAVASMLYLDYDRMPGEWFPNRFGTNHNLEAVAFFKKLNTAVFERFGDILMIAEESGSYGKLTRPVSEGGLGFNMKWNMGWANDFYDYLSTDPIYRKHKHKALNFPIMYAFTENYCLPISHDEVVHGKKSFIDKMYGSYEDKFSQMRTALMLMMSYPGKKLMFMGTEYAQFREWDYSNSLEWFMTDYPKHKQMQEFVMSLNDFYLSRPELWEMDFSEKGFSWIFADDNERNIVCFRRHRKNSDSIIIILSFSGSDQNVRIPLNKSKYLKPLFSSEAGLYQDIYKVEKDPIGYYVNLKINKYSGVILKEQKSDIKIKKI